MIEAEGRALIVAEARTWVATPYHDAARIKGGGTDCAMFIHCVFVAVGLIPDRDIPYYSPQQFLHSDAEDYLKTVRGFSREIAAEETKPGDIVLYKLGKAFGHGAIIMPPGWPAIIHAHAPSRMVVEGHGLDTALGRPWRERKFFSYW